MERPPRQTLACDGQGGFGLTPLGIDPALLRRGA
jgi:hypothetical protein